MAFRRSTVRVGERGRGMPAPTNVGASAYRAGCRDGGRWWVVATPIFHITHVENLRSVAELGLLCDSGMEAKEIAFRSIAYASLKAQRAAKEVDCEPGGTLADYVPFYFASRSPMLYTISLNNVAGAEGQQEKVVHLVLSAEALFDRQPCVFTNGHAIIDISDFYNDLVDLDKIDWDVMKAKYWSTDGTGEMRRKRQAEFLAQGHVPWQMVQAIGVRDAECEGLVAETLTGVAHVPAVLVRPHWYY